MASYSEMGKEALRTEMRNREISYSKMDNAAMRAALEADDASIADKIAEDDKLQAEADAAYAKRQDDKRLDAERVEQAEAVLAGKHADLSTLDINGIDDRCPHCGVHLSNGVCSYEDLDAQGKKATTHEYTCLGCNGEWGPKVGKRTSTPSKGGTGIKIEANREQKNGVKRPSIGGVCRAVWDYLDELVAGGKDATAKAVREAAPGKGWNANNASIEFYQWRKFNGITGRAK